jgi:two-component system CheB/CheR fusion protein
VSDARELLERAEAVLRRNAAVRVESSRAQTDSRDLRSQLSRLRHTWPVTRDYRLAALNLMEDAAVARRREEAETRQREEAEVETRRTAERYRQLIESMGEGFAIVDAIGDVDPAVDALILECNPAFAAFFGRDDLHGERLSDLLGAGTGDWMRHLERVRRTGETALFDHYVPGPDRWISVSVTRGALLREKRLAVLATDVTWRRRADARLRASEIRFRLIVENAREFAIFAMDPDRRIVSWNTGAQSILGWSENEVVGESADIIFTSEDRAAGVPAREAALAIADDRASDERWHVRKDGSRFFGSGVMTAMRDDHGEVMGLLKIFRDQTAERNAKQALEQARADAEAATRAKDQFLAVLSHELRTPLTPVLLATEMLQDRDDLPADVVETLAMIRRNVELEAHFVDDLLDVTRIVRGKMELARQRLDLHDVVARAVEVVRGDVEAKHQTLDVDLRAARRGVVGDPARLQQAFWNLLKNASKFTPEGRTIRLGTRDGGDAIEVEIADEGIGIEPTQLGAIFDPFVQADATIAREFGGLGLGLAIARATVEAHGGELVARSEGRGRGATFTVTLPLAP